ncbi:MAG: hypothetical protein B7Z15_21125 [Rhizobiales bacterium 32-66-8]|nr:MAG: hypothetical protein B7Z15_21125 [Rhizobiales bacterium 32-66-8]
MKTRTLIGTALLLSTAGLGVALAATQVDHLDQTFLGRDEATRADTPPLPAPIPDNGLFQGKARPKVEVQ